MIESQTAAPSTPRRPISGGDAPRPSATETRVVRLPAAPPSGVEPGVWAEWIEATRRAARLAPAGIALRHPGGGAAHGLLLLERRTAGTPLANDLARNQSVMLVAWRPDEHLEAAATSLGPSGAGPRGDHGATSTSAPEE